MKKIKFRSCAAIRIVLTGILLVISLSACAGKKYFNPSSEMLSTIDLFESVEGLEQVDDKWKSEFVETINRKFDIKKVEDLTGKMKMDVEGSMKMEELGGMEMDMPLTADIGFEVNVPDELSHMNMDMKISVMGMGLDMTMESYADAKNKVSYTRTSAFGENGNWEKSVIEDKEGSINDEWKKSDVLIKEDSITAIYQDPESKAYAVQLQLDNESVASGLMGGVGTSMDSFGENGVDLSKVIAIATFDEGLAFAGLYVDMTDALEMSTEGYQYNITKAAISVKLDTLNDGLTIAIPEEALNAAEKDSSESEGLFDMFGSDSDGSNSEGN